DCPNLRDLLLQEPNKRTDVQWSGNNDGAKYPVHLSIRTVDRTGLLADVTGALSKVEANIVDARAKVLDVGQAMIYLTVEVRDVEHLDQALQHIQKVNGILDVERSVVSSEPKRQASHS
ncbi:MAG TPA: ACT domain-containing protein, partial [Acidobacteriota bacterium]|nr:ACT domain-containing protein [Acidobacteriota bacterium]